MPFPGVWSWTAFHGHPTMEGLLTPERNPMSVPVESSAGAAPSPAAAGTVAPVAPQLLAQRTLAARPSEVRKVFKAAQRPGMISFANGAPYLGALPFDRIAADAQRILLDNGERAF